jgi:hypothetical protein
MFDITHALDEGQPQKALRLLKHGLREQRFPRNHLP